MISSRSSLPGLKCGTRLAGTTTPAPVLGLRPVRLSRLRMRKEPNPLSSILSPRCRASMMVPHSSGLKGSKEPLRELRPRQGKSPLRVVYAFDPQRDAVLLIGGDKGSDARFYERIIPRAERIWKEYLVEQAKGLHEEKP